MRLQATAYMYYSKHITRSTPWLQPHPPNVGVIIAISTLRTVRYAFTNAEGYFFDKKGVPIMKRWNYVSNLIGSVCLPKHAKSGISVVRRLTQFLGGTMEGH